MKPIGLDCPRYAYVATALGQRANAIQTQDTAYLECLRTPIQQVQKTEINFSLLRLWPYMEAVANAKHYSVEGTFPSQQLKLTQVS